MNKKIFATLAVITCFISVLHADTLLGDWVGELPLRDYLKLKLVLHIDTDALVTMDSPDQSAYDIKCDVSYLSGDSISLSVPKLGVTYFGKLKNDSIIAGRFKQGMFDSRLDFKRTYDSTRAAEHWQTPQPPFPYATEEVKIENPSAPGVTLAGTLTIPENYVPGKTGVVVLVSGSGLQNRDEELFRHRPFAVISDALAKEGVASLRYDDRGAFESTGDATEATTIDFASDAAAVIDWLRKSKRFGKVGLVGHSEGGMIGYMLGAGPKKGRPDFVVSLAGPAVNGIRTLGFQNEYTLRRNGVNGSEATDFRKAFEKTLEYLLSHPDVELLTDAQLAEFYPQKDESATTKLLSSQLRKAALDLVKNPWMRWFLAYDPMTDLKKTAVPTVIFYGDKDMQVPMEMNMAAVYRSGNDKVNRMIVGMNHVLQPSDTGNPEEYIANTMTVALPVLELLTQCVQDQIEGGKRAEGWLNNKW